MKLKKQSIAIGIITLFIGLAITPMSSAENNKIIEDIIPVEVTICQNNGIISTETIKLTNNDITTLENLIQKLQNVKNEEEIKEKITEFLKYNKGRGWARLLDLDWLQNLQGRPIISCGKGHKILTRYHGRVQIKKLLTAWSYPDGFGTTVIWGNGITAPPTQILLIRQIGFMIGFVGLYIHIPPLMSGMSSRTMFMGSSLFAWGAAI
jgi:hypothetical protein